MLEIASAKVIGKAAEQTMSRTNEFRLQAEIARETMQQNVFRVGELSAPELKEGAAMRARETTAAAELRSAVAELSSDLDQSPKDGLARIGTINQSLEGNEHPMTGVTFELDKTLLRDGTEAEGVFADFESEFDAALPKDMWQKSDYEHLRECNAQLARRIDSDPALRDSFAGNQLEQIRNGDTPEGYTWHHHQMPGKMQLVETGPHTQTGHTGGRSTWGGGSEMRLFS